MRFSDIQLSLFVGFVVALTHGYSCDADANQDDEQQLALFVARTAANEAGMSSPRDVVLIYQAAMYNGGGSVRRATRWLARHSRRVNGNATCAPRADGRVRNCEWSRDLRWNNERPERWPGVWRASRWQRQRTFALDVVQGRAPQRACAVDVVTWGKRTARDFRNGSRIPIDCGARNLAGTTRAILDRHRHAL